jgi:hypothetical protein
LGLLPEWGTRIGLAGRGDFGIDGTFVNEKIVRPKRGQGIRSRVKKEPLLNTLARKVGLAAGVIANAAQALSGETPAPVIKTEAKRKSGKRKRRSSTRAPQKNNKRTAKGAK